MYPVGASTSAGSVHSAGTVPAQDKPPLSLDEKRRLLVMRVQIKLLSVGIYSDRVSGELDS